MNSGLCGKHPYSAKNDFVFLSYSVNRMSVCLTFYQFRDTSWKKSERYRNTHSTASEETETDQSNHTKPENSPTEKKFLLRMAISRWQNRYSEEYEAHVHILYTNNFLQVSQASRSWAESEKSVRSARMTYLPPLFQLTVLKHETAREYITKEWYKGIQTDVRNTVTN
jgi:hypothetical protein